MKAFAAVVFTLFVSNTHASWITTKCSNSDGSVTWEKGYDQSLINMKYANFVEGTLTLQLDKVNIQFMKEVTLKERSFRTCAVAGSARVYAGKVRITGSEKHPEILRSQFPENRVLTEVICTTQVMTNLPCSNE